MTKISIALTAGALIATLSGARRTIRSESFCDCATAIGGTPAGLFAKTLPAVLADKCSSREHLQRSFAHTRISKR
jgi:hypothetical protein